MVARLYLLPKVCVRQIIISRTRIRKEKHKVDDAVTVDKKHSNNDIQRPEEEDKQ
jgi:hypothetical protein